MTQATPIIGAGQSGLVYRQQDNDGKQALLNHHKGATAPTYAEAGMIWLDDSATPWVLKIHDGTDWIAFGDVNATDNTFTPYLGSTQLGANGTMTISGAGAPAFTASSSDITTGDKGMVSFESNNDASSSIAFASLQQNSQTVTAGAEDGLLKLNTLRGGTMGTRLLVGDGLYTPNATDPGTDGIGAHVIEGGVLRTAQVSIATDTAYSFTPQQTSGYIFIHTQTGNANNRLLAAYTLISGQTMMASIYDGSVYVATTGALTGTTGTAGKVTVSACSDGKIYIENRIGATYTFSYSLIG